LAYKDSLPTILSSY